jgi:nanoRNase/pAp phosphatase (c-di-AMP/oligoRNAs hydrolase)
VSTPASKRGSPENGGGERPKNARPKPSPKKALRAVPSGTSEAVERAKRLRELLERRRGEKHVVAIQDFPDPDAISSALAYREMAREHDIEVDVLYDGTISHPENLALVNLLEIDVVRYTETTDLKRFDAVVYVDTQGGTTRLSHRLSQAEVETLVIIDHHERQEDAEAAFVDVRPVGAAATLMAEYLETGELLALDSGNRTHVQLATALMHGLHSETDGFIRSGAEEYSAAAFLHPFVDTAMLERVLCVERSQGTMNVIQMALANRTIRGGFSVAGVGHVRWGDRDAIPQAADFLLTEENVTTVIVYGMLWGDDGREVISGSLRTSNATLGVDGFLKRALGKDTRGNAYGGGRARAGGFEIDIGFLAGEGGDREQRRMKWSLYNEQIRRKLFRAAGLEPEEDASELMED